jgi:hypothetical protein
MSNGHENQYGVSRRAKTISFLSLSCRKRSIFRDGGHFNRRSVKLPRVTNLDVAPTLAELLGVQLPDARDFGMMLRHT